MRVHSARDVDAERLQVLHGGLHVVCHREAEGLRVAAEHARGVDAEAAQVVHGGPHVVREREPEQLRELADEPVQCRVVEPELLLQVHDDLLEVGGRGEPVQSGEGAPRALDQAVGQPEHAQVLRGGRRLVGHPHQRLRVHPHKVGQPLLAHVALQVCGGRPDA